jgi:hypothetical protein
MWFRLLLLLVLSRYVKQLKMEILTLLASTSNVYEIVGELTEYARDINTDIAREAVKAVGRIALSVGHLAQDAWHAWPSSSARGLRHASSPCCQMF